MPTIGWFEILLIVAISIVVIGPKDFPVMLKKIGSWIGTAKKYINEIQNEVSIDLDENFEDDVTDLRNYLKNIPQDKNELKRKCNQICEKMINNNEF